MDFGVIKEQRQQAENNRKKTVFDLQIGDLKDQKTRKCKSAKMQKLVACA